MTAMEESHHHFNKNDKESIGRELRRRRDARRITRVRLSEVLGVDARTIARWELEGCQLDDLDRASKGLESLRPDMGGISPTPVKLDRASTLDLALELASRARIMEERDRRLLELKQTLKDAELGYMWPEGL